MKKLICFLISFSMFSNIAMAECDFTDGKGVNKVDGGYLYSKECHVAVGQLKQDNNILGSQNLKLNQALDLKDIAISKADQRADLWMNTSFKLEDRINTIDSMRSTNQYIAFGLGILTMFAAAYAASQIQHR